MLKWGDQILTATNAKRQAINTQMRMLEGRSGSPVDGDKMICLRNYWDDLSEEGNPLINGTIGILKNSYQTWREIPTFVPSSIRRFDVMAGDLVIPDIEDEYSNVEMDHEMILTGQKCCGWQLSYKLGKLRPKYGDLVPKEFAYAYAITCHKAQGSSWPNVVVLEESFPFDKMEHAHWLYTACTRAEKKLVLVR